MAILQFINLIYIIQDRESTLPLEHHHRVESEVNDSKEFNLKVLLDSLDIDIYV